MKTEDSKILDISIAISTILFAIISIIFKPKLVVEVLEKLNIEYVASTSQSYIAIGIVGAVIGVLVGIMVGLMISNIMILKEKK